MSSEKEFMQGIVRKLSNKPSQFELIQSAIELGNQELDHIENLFGDTLEQVKGFSFGSQEAYHDIQENISSNIRNTRHLLKRAFTLDEIDRMSYTEKQEAKLLQTKRMHYMNDLLTRQQKQN